MVPKKWVDEVWRRPSVGYLVVLIGLAVSLYWCWHLPAPGYAVTAMGAAVAVMSLRIEPKALERAAWVVLIFGLLAVEIRAIRHDRTDNQTQQAAQRRQEEENFSQIGRDIDSQIQQSSKQFTETMSSTNALIAQSKKNMDAVTGGDSYCYVMASNLGGNAVLLIVATEGSSPLHDVLVERTDVNDLRGILHKEKGLTWDKSRSLVHEYPIMPSLTSTSGRFIEQLQLGDSDKRDFAFTFFATNGVWNERLNLRRVEGIWVQAWKVTRQVPSGIGGHGKKGHGGSSMEVVLSTFVDPKYPKMNGKVDW